MLPTLFYYGSDFVPDEKLEEKFAELSVWIKEQIRAGFTTVAVGGGRGLESLVALLIVRLRQSNPELRLVRVILPTDYRGETAEDRDFYEWLLEQADEVR